MVTNVLDYLYDKVSRFPDKTGIADDKRSLTFCQWADESENIGSRLIEATGGVMRHPVLVFVDRKIETLVGFMGVVESGNFYVPIDCKMPYERVKLISDVCQPIAAITISDKDNTTLDLVGFNGVRLSYAEAKDAPKNLGVLADVRRNIIDLDPVYSIFIVA